MAKRTIEELNLMDDFLFQEVLSDLENGPTVARLILSVIMGCPIGDVKIHTQKMYSGKTAYAIPLKTVAWKILIYH